MDITTIDGISRHKRPLRILISKRVLSSTPKKGTAKIIVNKAQTVNNSQYGGSLVSTDHYDTGSILTVSGSSSILINYAQNGGLFIQDNAQFKMDSASAKISVNNRAYFGGASTQGALTAGTIEIINGNFR